MCMYETGLLIHYDGMFIELIWNVEGFMEHEWWSLAWYWHDVRFYFFMALGRLSYGWLNMRYEWGVVTKIDMILTCVVNISWLIEYV